MENQSGTTEGGAAPANISVEQLVALIKKPSAAAAAAAGSEAASGEAVDEGAAETTTTTEGAGAPEVTDSPSDGSEAEGAEGNGEGEAADAEGAEGDESPDETEGEADVPKAIKDLQKRVGKLTARAKAAEEESDRLRTELKAGKPAGDEARGRGANSEAVAGLDPRFAQDKGLLEVATELQKTDGILAAVEEALESGEEQLKIGDREFTRAELRAIRRNAEGQRTALTAKREARTQQLEAGFQRALGESAEAAVKAYPWMAKAESAEFQAAVTTLQSLPALALLPDRALILGDYIEGRKLRMAKGKTAPTITKPAAAKPGAKPAPMPAGVRSAAPKVDAKKAGVAEAEGKFKQSGRVEDLTALLKARKVAA